MKLYLFHGNKMMARQLFFKDREGVSYSDNPDGLPYITTVLGQEYFEPGDYEISTLDGEVTRVVKKDAFEPFAKEVQDASAVAENAARGNDGGNAGGDLYRQSISRYGDGGIRPSDADAKTLGKAGIGRTRRAAQRSAGNHRADEGRPHAKPKRPVTHYDGD